MVQLQNITVKTKVYIFNHKDNWIFSKTFDLPIKKGFLKVVLSI